jgi:hypothetical protein
MIKPYHTILSNLLLVAQFIAAVMGLIFWKKVKDNFWKWLVIFLALVFCFELFAKYGLHLLPRFKKHYYAFLVIPFQFIFLYWLYFFNNKKNKWLYILFTVAYLIVLLFSSLKISNNDWIIQSLSYTTGNLFLAIIALMEFNRQIKTDSILQFKQNMMFYVNTGVIVFYIGTLPFFAFYNLLFNNYQTIWLVYYTIFLVFNHFMYLLFAAAFIWAKPNSYQY